MHHDLKRRLLSAAVHENVTPPGVAVRTTLSTTLRPARRAKRRGGFTQAVQALGPPRRIVVVAGMTTASLLLIWSLCHTRLLGSTRLGGYVAKHVPPALCSGHPQPAVGEPVLMPQRPPQREFLLPQHAPQREFLLPQHAPQRDHPPHRRWTQTTVAHRIASGQPFMLPVLPRHHLPAGAPVIITLEEPERRPAWLTFDTATFTLRGTVPPHETGKTYTLTFLAHTPHDLASRVYVTLSVVSQAQE